jgi:hypothetical protein
MLHFDCSAAHAKDRSQRVTADACVLGSSLEQAEALAREAIAGHAYQAEGLIAYNTLEESGVAKLAGYETALYLKALQHKSRVAVVFS